MIVGVATTAARAEMRVLMPGGIALPPAVVAAEAVWLAFARLRAGERLGNGLKVEDG